MICLRDHHEAIIDRATWDAVQAELSRRRNSKRKERDCNSASATL